MKKKLLIILVIFSLIVSSTQTIQADDCTRAWANSYHQISDEYTEELISCAGDVVMAWLTADVMAFTNMGCANDAYWSYAYALDNAAAQYLACY